MGLGISEFLDDTGGKKSGDGVFAPNWKDDKSVVVWLHTLQAPKAYYIHRFMVEDEREEKDDAGNKTGKMLRYLQFPKFVGAESKQCYEKQYFRDRNNGQLQVLPLHDPFLILREYLRKQVLAKTIAEDAVVFEWNDRKNKDIIQWEAGVISKVVKSGQNNWNHSLDAKYECIFTIVRNDDPGAGAMLSREGRALSDAVRNEITKQRDSRGFEEGDPMTTPYAFRWIFNKEAKMNEMYMAYRYDKAEYTDEIYAAVTSETAPDVSEYIVPRNDDEIKIRAAFEAAAQIELPLDAIFSSDLQERAALLTGASQSRPIISSPRTPTQAAARPPAKPGAARPGAAAPQALTETTTAPGLTRTRVKVEPATTPCDDCKHPMLLTDAVCAKCGAVYTITGGDTAPEPGAVPAPEPEPKKTAAAKATKTNTAAKAAAEAMKGEPGPTDACWACGQRAIVRNDDGDLKCEACGVPQEDQIPY